MRIGVRMGIGMVMGIWMEMEWEWDWDENRDGNGMRIGMRMGTGKERDGIGMGIWMGMEIRMAMGLGRAVENGSSPQTCSSHTHTADGISGNYPVFLPPLEEPRRAPALPAPIWGSRAAPVPPFPCPKVPRTMGSQQH